MVKHNTPDWQISAFDKDNNSCVKTKPFNKRLKELEAAYAKGKQTTVKVEGIDVSILSLKEEPVKEDKDEKDEELQQYQDMRDRFRKEELEKSRRDENKVVFTSAPRQDPNRGMRFLKKPFDSINKDKLGSSRIFTKKKDKEYY